MSTKLKLFQNNLFENLKKKKQEFINWERSGNCKFYTQQRNAKKLEKKITVATEFYISSRYSLGKNIFENFN